MFAKRAESARRRDDDQRFEVVPERALIEQLGGLGDELLLLELVIVGLLVGRAGAADAREGPAGRVALQLPVLGIGMAVLVLDDQIGKVAVALVAEEKRLLAVGDDDEAVGRNPHLDLLAGCSLNAAAARRLRGSCPCLGPARRS